MDDIAWLGCGGDGTRKAVADLLPTNTGVANRRIRDGQQFAVPHELALAIAPGVAKATMPTIDYLVVRQLCSWSCAVTGVVAVSKRF
jgi:hypothetical protein